MLEPQTSMAAARRTPLPTPSPASDEQRVTRLQEEARMRIGRRLKRLRQDAGLTLRALEARANISVSCARTGPGQFRITRIWFKAAEQVTA